MEGFTLPLSLFALGFAFVSLRRAAWLHGEVNRVNGLIQADMQRAMDRLNDHDAAIHALAHGLLLATEGPRHDTSFHLPDEFAFAMPAGAGTHPEGGH